MHVAPPRAAGAAGAAALGVRWPSVDVAPRRSCPRGSSDREGSATEGPTHARVDAGGGTRQLGTVYCRSGLVARVLGAPLPAFRMQHSETAPYFRNALK